MRNVRHFEAALFKTPVGAAIPALIGLIAAEVCLLVFFFHMLETNSFDFGALIVNFLACGVGAGIGLLLLRRLFPRSSPETLFGSGGVFGPSTARTEIFSQTGECLPDGTKTAGGMLGGQEADLIRNRDRRQSISRYKEPEGGGVIGLISMIGISSVMMARVSIGWEFLSLALLGGGAVALVLYWGRRRRQNSSISSYKTSEGGGVIGFISMIGISFVLMGCCLHFVRQFLGLAVIGGVVVALVLYWGRRRSQDSSSSFV
jgi:hypothetical protein